MTVAGPAKVGRVAQRVIAAQHCPTGHAQHSLVWDATASAALTLHEVCICVLHVKMCSRVRLQTRHSLKGDHSPSQELADYGFNCGKQLPVAKLCLSLDSTSDGHIIARLPCVPTDCSCHSSQQQIMHVHGTG